MEEREKEEGEGGGTREGEREEGKQDEYTDRIKISL